MRTVYMRGKPRRVLVLTFSRTRIQMFKELALNDIGYTELSKKYGITKDRARKTTGQIVYWLKMLAEDVKDEEMEAITLRREAYEQKYSVRQYLSTYGLFLISKIEHYQTTGRIRLTDEDVGTKAVWEMY